MTRNRRTTAHSDESDTPPGSGSARQSRCVGTVIEHYPVSVRVSKEMGNRVINNTHLSRFLIVALF